MAWNCRPRSKEGKDSQKPEASQASIWFTYHSTIDFKGSERSIKRVEMTDQIPPADHHL